MHVEEDHTNKQIVVKTSKSACSHLPPKLRLPIHWSPYPTGCVSIAQRFGSPKVPNPKPYPNPNPYQTLGLSNLQTIEQPLTPLPASSLDLSDLPFQTASISVQAFLHSPLDWQTHRQTDGYRETLITIGRYRCTDSDAASKLHWYSMDIAVWKTQSSYVSVGGPIHFFEVFSLVIFTSDLLFAGLFTTVEFLLFVIPNMCLLHICSGIALIENN